MILRNRKSGHEQVDLRTEKALRRVTVKSRENGKALKKEAKEAAPRMIQLPKLDIRILQITLIGDSELICNRKTERAMKKMLDKQQQVAQAGKEPRQPEREYNESFYRDGETYLFPAIAFKNAAVSACTSIGKNIISKVAARQSHHIIGDFVALKGTPYMRQDLVRVGMGSDLRYRGAFKEWSVSLKIRYNALVLSAEQLVNLYNIAGFAVGVGDWRPERDGNHGMFHVQTQKEV